MAEAIPPSFQTVQPPGHSRHSCENLGESSVSTFLRAMDRAGCDAFLNVHGDEALPFNFLAGSEGMLVWGRRLEALHGGERSLFSSLDSRFSSEGRSAWPASDAPRNKRSWRCTNAPKGNCR